jgi:hypothetical protein
LFYFLVFSFTTLTLASFITSLVSSSYIVTRTGYFGPGVYNDQLQYTGPTGNYSVVVIAHVIVVNNTATFFNEAVLVPGYYSITVFSDKYVQEVSYTETAALFISSAISLFLVILIDRLLAKLSENF